MVAVTVEEGYHCPPLGIPLCAKLSQPSLHDASSTKQG